MTDVIPIGTRGAKGLYGWDKEEGRRPTSHDVLETVFPAPTDEINKQLLATGRWKDTWSTQSGMVARSSSPADGRYSGIRTAAPERSSRRTTTSPSGSERGIAARERGTSGGRSSRTTHHVFMVDAAGVRAVREPLRR